MKKVEGITVPNYGQKKMTKAIVALSKAAEANARAIQAIATLASSPYNHNVFSSCHLEGCDTRVKVKVEGKQ
jgi:hypothetical protein